MKHPTRWLFVILIAVLAACSGAPEELPDDGFVTVRDARVAYRVLGGGVGVPALFIHGGPGGNGCGFEGAVDQLSRSRPVIVYDQIGAGHSSWIPEDRRADFADHARFVEEIEALRDELQLEELHLVGSSWGTAVALEYLLTGDSAGIRSVSFVGPYFSTERWLADTDILVETLSDSSQAAIAEALATGAFDSPEFEAANTEFASMYGVRTPRDERDRGACDWTPSLGSATGMYEYMWGPTEFVSTGTLKDYDRLSRLSELRLPTLFVRAEFDEPSHETVAEFAAMVPGAQFHTIADAGHGVYIDQPEEFDRVLLEFLASVEGR